MFTCNHKLGTHYNFECCFNHTEKCCKAKCINSWTQETNELIDRTETVFHLAYQSRFQSHYVKLTKKVLADIFNYLFIIVHLYDDEDE